MAKTAAATPARKAHIKFSEPETPLTGYVTAEEELSASEDEDDDDATPRAVPQPSLQNDSGDSGDDDEDDAPEDVSFSGGKSSARAQSRARQLELETMKSQERAKRAAKAEKIKAEKESSKKKHKTVKKARLEAAEDEVPVFLSQALLKQVTTELDDDDDREDDQSQMRTNKRKVFTDDPEIDEVEKEDRKIKLLKPIKARVMAPPAAAKTIKSKEKWLKRKTAADAKQQRLIMRA
ncbi:hypothetical protein BZA70DRAFT_270228 [Myxozyma melibiosi]|uniref:Uncharacterized protein n=1 Tax=Myxozyma melibiosi TaxID=54550 RepID=A0ABR1FAZ2_9ASCO